MNKLDEQEFFDRMTLELNGIDSTVLDISYRPMKTVDTNWRKLTNEKRSYPVIEKKPLKISNCIVKQWYDTDRLSAEYDISYTDSTKCMNKKINGEFDNQDPASPITSRVVDALRTLVARSNGQLKQVKKGRFYLPDDIKTAVNDFYFVQVVGDYHKASWYVFRDAVYPARLNQTQYDCDRWIFNHRRRIELSDFLEKCWEAI